KVSCILAATCAIPRLTAVQLTAPSWHRSCSTGIWVVSFFRRINRGITLTREHDNRRGSHCADVRLHYSALRSSRCRRLSVSSVSLRRTGRRRQVRRQAERDDGLPRRLLRRHRRRLRRRVPTAANVAGPPSTDALPRRLSHLLRTGVSERGQHAQGETSDGEAGSR